MRAPRIHVEDGLLSLEPGFAEAALESLLGDHPRHEQFPTLNMFFGGAHVAMAGPGGDLQGAGDPRRGGVSLVV